MITYLEINEMANHSLLQSSVVAIFVNLISVVEGTYENVNTVNILVFTVATISLLFGSYDP